MFLVIPQVRYRRAAKALMRLNPENLRTRTPEEIDENEWETLETAITLWIQHLEVAVTTVLVSEKETMQPSSGKSHGRCGLARMLCKDR